MGDIGTPNPPSMEYYDPYTATGDVAGGSALVTVGQLARVTAAGTLGESATRTLSAATGNEVAWALNYTVNKLTSGNDTGLQINMTDTASPGTSLPFQVNVGGTHVAGMTVGGSYITGPVTTLSASSGSYDVYATGYRRAAYFAYANLSNDGLFGWSSGTTATGTFDAAISRSAAGLVQISNGTAGKWAGLDVGLINLKSLATPTGLTVVPQGTTGATTYGYKVAALLADGTTTTAATSEVTIADGNATLTATEFNRISWTAVTGATSYNVFRTTGGASQGKITATPITAVTLDDTGIAASGTAPTSNATGSLLWATDGGGSIGASAGNRPYNITAIGTVLSTYSFVAGAGYYAFVSRSSLSSSADGVVDLKNVTATSFTRLNFGGTTNSFPGLASTTATVPNSLQLQSAAGTQVWNDAVTAESATVAVRSLLDIATPTLTSTNASVTYTVASALHLGLPAASTNVTITAGGALSLLADGPIRASAFEVGAAPGVDGTFTTVDSKTVTVTKGIITSIAA